MTIADELRRLLAAQLRALSIVSRRLAGTRDRLARHFPVKIATLGSLDEPTIESMDALIKRFEQLQNGLQDQLFRSLALAEGEDLRDRSRRDLAELMERLGVIESAQAWSELAVLRNRLAHAYPNDKRRQVRVLNETYEATGRVIAAFDRAAARARSRLRRRMVRKKVPAPRRAR